MGVQGPVPLEVFIHVGGSWAGIHHAYFGYVLRAAMKILDRGCEVQVGRSGGTSPADGLVQAPPAEVGD